MNNTLQSPEVPLRTKEEIDAMVVVINETLDRYLARLKSLEADNKSLKETLCAAETRGARRMLRFLHVEAEEWRTDTDGEIDDTGTARGTTTHTVVFDDSVLEELMAMAGAPPWGEHAIDKLRRIAPREA